MVTPRRAASDRGSGTCKSSLGDGVSLSRLFEIVTAGHLGCSIRSAAERSRAAAMTE